MAHATACSLTRRGIGAKSGPGYLSWSAWELLAVEAMYVGLIVIALPGFVLSLVLSLVLNEPERLIVPWRTAR